MKFELTQQQRLIKKAINFGTKKHVIVNASSGSSKSSSVIISVSDRAECPFKTGLVLAFNAKIAKENKKEFPSWCEVRTNHSLAYEYIVRPDKLTVKNNVQAIDFTGRHTQKIRQSALYYLNKFCASESLNIKDFIASEGCYKSTIEEIYVMIKQIFVDSTGGKMPISHAVYIKVFQMSLAYGDISLPKYDFLFMDEFADVNMCYYSIFCNIDAGKKIAVGDDNQAIFTFNHSVDGLSMLEEKYPDDSITLSLDQTFRCSKEIAEATRVFGINHMDPDFEYHGVDVDTSDLKTFGFITRTNKELIIEALSCVEKGIKFNFARSVDSILGPPIYLKSGLLNDYKTLMEYEAFENIPLDKRPKDENKYIIYEYESFMMINGSENKSFTKYLINRGKEDSSFHPDLVRVAKLSDKFNLRNMIKLLKYAKDKSNHSENYVLGTAFSTKGISLDAVYIADDINELTENSIDDELREDESEIYLAYVACTRARKLLINAKILDYRGKDNDIGTEDGKYKSIVTGSQMTYGNFKGLLLHSIENKKLL